MLNFKINQEKCVKCGLCVQECPMMVLSGEGEFPALIQGKEDGCIKCQHCLAVCPTGALSILDVDPAKSVPASAELPSGEQMSNLIKLRRSVRKYKKEALDKEVISQMVNTALHSPTGHNAQAVNFVVIDDPKDMAEIVELTYQEVAKMGESGQSSEFLGLLLQFQKMWESSGIDIMFRGAPHLVIATAAKSCATPIVDSVIALTSFELLAVSSGFGTLWNGMVKFVVDSSPKLRKRMGIPDDHEIGYLMLLGKPATKYARAVQK